MHLMKQVLEHISNIVVPTEILEVEQKIIDIKEKKIKLFVDKSMKKQQN
jgi:hypothetical protein